MEIAQIEALLAVVRAGNFTRAANRLNLTQPSLSARIRRLEHSLGGELFHRDKRPVQLTVLGRVFIDYAERAMGILDAGRQAVRTAQLGVADRVAISCPFSLATYLMPQVVSRFSHEYPYTELYVETGHSDFAVSQLLDGLVNLAFAAAFPRFLAQTQTLVRFHDQMVVSVTPDHELASAGQVSLGQLWQYQLLIIHWGTAFDAYVESLRQMDGATGPTIRVPLASALPMARKPNAVTFLPRRLAAVTGLVEISVPEFRFDWDVSLMTRPGRTLTLLEQAFVDITSAVWQSSEPQSDD
jgi:DNA-binding transcriptional LysR family regulator